MKIYLASGWFSEEQEAARMDIIEALKAAKLDFYSPKDDLLYIPGVTSANSVFSMNLEQIESCDAVVASTVGKDMGTIFECGYAFGIDIPVIYYNPGLNGKFNIMLSESARAVCVTKNDLQAYMYSLKHHNKAVHIPFLGEKE